MYNAPWPRRKRFKNKCCIRGHAQIPENQYVNVTNGLIKCKPCTLLLRERARNDKAKSKE